RDDREGPASSRADHYWEWVTVVDGRSGEAARAEQARLMERQHSIHFHCWTPRTFPRFVAEAVDYDALDVALVFYEARPYEMTAVRQRGAGSARAAAASEPADPLVDELVALRAEVDVLRGTAVVRLRDWLLSSPVFARPTRLAARMAKGLVPR